MPVLDKELDVIISDTPECLGCGKNEAVPGASYCLTCAMPEPGDPLGVVRNEVDAEMAARRELAERELCRRRLLPLVHRLKPDYLAGWFHKDLAARLERFARRVEAGDGPCLILNTPPRHGKSELASKIFVAWFLGRNPTNSMIAATHSDKLAMDNSRDVLQYVRDARYSTVFADTVLDKDNKGAMGWRTTKGGAYKPVGVGAGIAGYGANILVIDDPHRDRDAYSEAVRDNIWRWYNSSAKTRLMPGGGRLIIQTRWVLDDLTGRLIEDEGRIEDGGKWEVVCYPAQAEQDEYRTPSGRIISLPEPGAALLRRKGEYLHPERYPEKELLQHKKDPIVWGALYQQNPTAGDAAVFKQEEITLCKLADIPKKLVYYTAVDLAISMTQRSDFSVLLHGGVDVDDTLWLVDLERGKWDPMELCDRILDSWERYEQDMLGIEKNHLQMAIAPFLNKRAEERELYAFSPTELDHGNKDKLARARPIQARMRQGKVMIPEDAPWAEQLLKEMFEFPVGRHDDCVDALAWLGQMLDSMMRAPGEPTAKRKKGWRDKIRATSSAGQKTWKTA